MIPVSCCGKRFQQKPHFSVLNLLCTTPKSFFQLLSHTQGHFFLFFLSKMSQSWISTSLVYFEERIRPFLWYYDTVRSKQKKYSSLFGVFLARPESRLNTNISASFIVAKNWWFSVAPSKHFTNIHCCDLLTVVMLHFTAEPLLSNH